MSVAPVIRIDRPGEELPAPICDYCEEWAVFKGQAGHKAVWPYITMTVGHTCVEHFENFAGAITEEMLIVRIPAPADVESEGEAF